MSPDSFTTSFILKWVLELFGLKELGEVSLYDAEVVVVAGGCCGGEFEGVVAVLRGEVVFEYLPVWWC